MNALGFTGDSGEESVMGKREDLDGGGSFISSYTCDNQTAQRARKVRFT